jgi:hypothetical protein
MPAFNCDAPASYAPAAARELRGDALRERGLSSPDSPATSTGRGGGAGERFLDPVEHSGARRS